MEKERFDKRLLLGIIIVLAGIILLASNFGLINYNIGRYIFRWEMILIVLGLVLTLSRQNITTGVILFFVGGVFYVNHIFYLHLNIWQIVLPAVLILAGVLMIFRNKIERGWKASVVPDDEHHIDESAIFGGGDRVILSRRFEGGRVTTMFGGLNYDMLKARLAPGKSAIDVFCIFGGMKLVVPEDWNVKIKVLSLFGGFSDKRHVRQPEVISADEPQLVIKGTVIFGGGEITSYLD